MKATSIFGGVQVFEILISIVRSKFVAVFIGPAGIGIIGLLKSTLQIIAKLTSFGLRISAVRDVAAANASNNQEQIATTVTVLRRLIWFTGLLGFLVTFFTAPWLSQLTFGNQDYTFAFRWLSINFIIGQITTGHMVILQGLRKLKYLAKANIFGSFFGMLVTIPLYYLWGIDAIVPVLIATTLISLFVSIYFSNKFKIIKVHVTKKQTIEIGKGMASMGIVMSLTALMGSVSAYLLNIYISNYGTLADVGLYAAGFAIIGTYTNLFFTAMTKDYYPRLSEIVSDKVKTNRTVSEQAEIALLILAPILILFLIFVKWAVVILYSTKFLPVTDLIYWASLGIFFKVATWAMGFIFIAKGDKNWFFWSEFIAVFYVLGLNILGYKYFGLEGLGISFLITFILAFIQNLVITNWLYGFKYDKNFYKIFIILFSLAIMAFLLSYYVKGLWGHLLGIVIITVSAIYSYKELDKRMDIKEIVGGIKNKYLKKK